MKKMHTIYLLNFTLITGSLFINSLSAADMGTPRIVSAEEHALEQKLIHAINTGNKKRVVKILVQHPFLVNAKNNHGESPLMVAAYRGQTEIVEELIAVGANVNSQDNHGCIALMMAAHWGYAKIVDILITAGSQYDIKNQWGSTALLHAADTGDEEHKEHKETVERLITARANVNTISNDNRTPLIGAAIRGYITIVQVLLDAQADITIRNSENKNALELAQEKGHTAIVELLQNYVPIEPEEDTIMVKPAV